jgi:hypothetical protein
MAPRRERLDILQEEQAAAEAAMAVLQKQKDERKKEIDPEKEKRTADENGYMGVIARLMVAEDTSLKRRFVQQAAKTYGGVGDGRARRYLERVIGKIPVSHAEQAKPDPLEQAAAE